MPVFNDRIKLILLVVFCAAVLWPALSGPFLLDDFVHLEIVNAWLSGHKEISSVLNNHSGPFGRPISMISFMLNAMTTGMAAWPMKLTNLILHLVTGLFLYGLLKSLFELDKRLGKYATPLAVGLVSYKSKFSSFALSRNQKENPQHRARGVNRPSLIF